MGDDKETRSRASIAHRRRMSQIAARPLAPGSTFDQSFEIVQPLGHGAMGDVFLARDLGLDRLVAIKVIRKEAMTAAAMKQFVREARAMARVNHPNVVRIHAIRHHEDLPYIVMEFVPGGNLEDWIEEQGGLPLRAAPAMAILSEVCDGVQAIHDAGTVHGDIKPSNILVGPANSILIGDLGLARFLDETKEGEAQRIQCTPAYMAPEVLSMRALSEDLARRSDIYSIGVMAYEMLTGRLPFDSDDQVELMNLHVTVPPPPPSTVSELPAEVDEVLLTALDKDPAFRPASCLELCNALEAAIDMGSQAKMVLLVVDDDEQFLTYASACLSEGFPRARVITTSSADEALLEITKHEVSAAFVDLEMPGFNGLEFVAAVRSAQDRRVPIGIITAVGGARDWQVLRSLGADAFAPKPITPRELVRMCRRLVGGVTSVPPPRG